MLTGGFLPDRRILLITTIRRIYGIARVARFAALAFLVGDQALELEGFRVVDVLCFGSGARAAVHMASVGVVLCARVVFVVWWWVGGLGHGVHSVDVEENVDDWVWLACLFRGWVG